MNKAFRIIWSHARQAFVVTDELASAGGKRGGARLLLSAAGASLLAIASPNVAMATAPCSAGSNTISSAVASTCTLDGGASVTITNAGSITNTSGDAINSGFDADIGTISNAGQLTATGGNGITLGAGESGAHTGTLIENLAGADISSSDGDGIYLYNTFSLGSLTNSGTIQSASLIKAGINLNSATLGNLHNQSDGVISNTGSGGAIRLQGGASITNDLVNDGEISSNGSYAAIYGNDSSIGGDFQNNGEINNQGDGYESAIYLYGFSIGGDLINGTSGVIEGGEGAIDLSYSTITGDLVNQGTLTGRGDIAAVRLNDSTVSDIRNSGTIQGLYIGLDLDHSEVENIVNQAGGTIKGGDVGILIGSNSTVLGALSNSGTIQGGTFSILDSNSSTTLDTIYINGNDTARLLGDVRAYNADVIVKSGSVFANTNAFDVGSFTIEQGATLKMSAGPATSHIADGFTVSQGFSNAGTLSLAAGVTGAIHGDYTQTTSGALKIGVASDSSYGKLVVDNIATLANNAKIAVDVSPSNYSFSTKSLQNVLSAGTLVSDGTFTVSDNSTLFNFGAVKDGNTVDLTLTAATAPEQGNNGGLVEQIVTSLGNSPAVGAARVLDQVITSNPSGGLAGHFVGLTTEQEVSDAVTQTLPTVTGNTNNATGSTLAGINRVVQARQGENSGLSSGDAPLTEDNLWIKTFGSWADQDERSDISGYEADTQGLAIGADAAISDTTRLGLAFAYAQTNLDNDSRIAPQSADIDTFQLIGYGSYALAPNTELNFQLDGGKNQTEGQRHMPFADATAKSDYDGYNFHAGVGIGHSLRLSEQLTFVPSARADYTWIGSESHSASMASSTIASPTAPCSAPTWVPATT
jgi:outer membrane autotransporter protein